MSQHVLLIDNYDSFTYNLVQALRILGAQVTVKRHDKITVEEANALQPSHLMVPQDRVDRRTPGCRSRWWAT